MTTITNISLHLIYLLVFLVNTVSATTFSKDLVQVKIQTKEELQNLHQIGTDLDEHHADLNFVTIYADDAEQTALQAAGFNFQVIIENLSSYYAQRALNDRQTRLVTTNSMGGFRTLDEIEQTLTKLTKTFPNIVSKFSIGKTNEGRDIWAIRISDNPNIYEPNEPTVWFDALHHAREAMSGESLLLFATWLGDHYTTDPSVNRLLNSRNILLVPCVNPDGYEYNRQLHPDGGGMWRKNRQDNGYGSYGVDLNRNYGWEWQNIYSSNANAYQGLTPFSELETTAIRDLLTQQPPSVSISVHSYGNEWMYPWGYMASPTVDDAIFRAYTAKIAATNDYILDTAWNLFGSTYGASDDYHYGTYRSLAFTVEIGSYDDGFWPAPSRIPTLFATVLPGYKMVSQWAGAWATVLSPVWTEQQGNGDEWFNGGETWSLRLPIENEGIAPLNAEVSISSPSSDIKIDNGSFSVIVAPRQTILTQPLEFHFAATIASESPYVLNVALNYADIISYEPIKIWLGQPQISPRSNLITLAVWGQVAAGKTVHILVDGIAQVEAEVFWSLQATTGQQIPNIAGKVYLAGNIQPLVKGITNENGQLDWLLQLPEQTGLSGQTIYLQALLDRDGKPFVSKLIDVQFE